LQQVLPKGFCLSILLYVRGITTEKTVILICVILVGINTFIGTNSNSIFSVNKTVKKQRFVYFYCSHISVTLNLHIQETIAI